MAIRRPVALVLAFGLALPLAAWADDAATVFKVTRPGTVLVDRDARRAELASLVDAARRLCHIERPEAPSALTPVVALEGRLGYGGNDRHTTPFDWAVIVHGADAFAGSATARERFVTLLTNWAKAGAMTKLMDDVAGSNTSVSFGLKRTLATLIPNWALVRADTGVLAADRQLVDSWIARLVKTADTNTGGANRNRRVLNCPANQSTSNCNNHRYLRDEVNAMWGALAGDNARYARGIERVRVALRQMRPDGSLPLETARGSRALWYQNYALGMLVGIAEVAAHQGHDLYAMEVEGRTLHTAVAFLLEGIAHPRVVLPYAKANVSPGPGGVDWREQDLRFTEERGRWHHMAWTEMYTARFPDHANTRRLYQLLPGLLEDRPIATRTTGGNASCFFVRR
jgi:poly(beta-D-mannuronate) lyase